MDNPTTGIVSLPGAEVEVREVSALFERKLIVTGMKATETSMKDHSPNYDMDMVLLVAHGQMMGSNPLQSNLRFAPSAGDDGMLTVDEIFEMEIKANLVMLSVSTCGIETTLRTPNSFPRRSSIPAGYIRTLDHEGVSISLRWLGAF